MEGMDYTSYFSTTPGPYQQFLGLPPTPTYSNPDDALGGSAANNDSLDPSFLPSTFDAANVFQFAQAAPLHSLPLAVTGPGSPTTAPTPHIGRMDSIDSTAAMEGLESEKPHGGRTRSSSEEKEGLTPAQSRRKAQNRAAQRAFRERKERHVRDLEAKLSALESSASTLQSDNKRLKVALQRAQTENEILRATSSTNAGQLSASLSIPTSPHDDHDHHSNSGSSGVDSALGRSPTALHGGDKYVSTPLSISGEREKNLLSAGATWDLIQAHPLVKQGLVDVADVCERLKTAAQCDGQGPVFEEEEVRRAVEAGRRGGGDELI